MSSGPDYIVIRGVSDSIDGTWYDRSLFLRGRQDIPVTGITEVITLSPTADFEAREYDGAVAQVWTPTGVAT